MEKKLASALKTIEEFDEIERKFASLKETERQKSSELSALQKDKELFNMETEVETCYFNNSYFYNIHQKY